VATTLLPQPTIDEVDRLYRQLTQIHAIGAVQLAGCTYFGSTHSLTQA
jgi:hypothetical protein